MATFNRIGMSKIDQAYYDLIVTPTGIYRGKCRLDFGKEMLAQKRLDLKHPWISKKSGQQGGFFLRIPPNAKPRDFLALRANLGVETYNVKSKGKNVAVKMTIGVAAMASLIKVSASTWCRWETEVVKRKFSEFGIDNEYRS